MPALEAALAALDTLSKKDIDEVKALKKPPALSQIFGGMFVDQKIIKVQREVELERGRGREEEEGRRTVKEPGR